MKKLASASLLAVALLLVFAAPSLAWSGHHWHGGPRVFVSVGPRFWWGPYPYPYYYYPPPYYYTPPVVIQDPPVYVQQQPPAPAVQQQVSPSVPPAEAYWYYCAPSKEYYPRVPTCSEEWIKVPPRQE
ncbi:MAG TPA: hypothetical protein VHT71_09375 [Methylomirabilota bacterium]|jgi:hypothetical protein|nr:hypothetical protein [Methylomirabilota bacterium]